MAEPFFTGMTQAGRELRLFADGPPSDITILGTLDGVPIEVSRMSYHGFSADDDDAVTVVTDQGTFTAVASNGIDPTAHSQQLRLYLETRPPGGWTVSVEGRSFVEGEWHFDVSVGNDRLSPVRIEVRMSDALARSREWGRGEPPTDEMVAENVEVRFRRATWPDLQDAAGSPMVILGGRLRR